MPLCSIAKKPLGDWWFAVAEVSDTEIRQLEAALTEECRGKDNRSLEKGRCF